MLNVIVHIEIENGTEVFKGSRQFFDKDSLNEYIGRCESDGTKVLFIEDISMRPAVRKFMEVMQRLGVSFRSRDGYYYYYIEGKPHKYLDSKGPSAFEGVRVSELDMKLAVQNHINHLKGEEREEELSYIEDKYTYIEGAHLPIGQLSFDDILEEL